LPAAGADDAASRMCIDYGLRKSNIGIPGGDGVSEVGKILVVGMNRSGTKWISNILCNHPDVIGIQSARGGGIQETNMFGVMQKKFPDLTFVTDYIGLVELWSATDFFKISGIEKEFCYRLKPRPTNCLNMFSVLMSEYARRKGKRFWLQKADPQDGRRALEHFPDARCVIIRRDFSGVLTSVVKLWERSGRKRKLLNACFLFALQEKTLDAIIAHREVCVCKYEDLKRNPREEVHRVCSALGLHFHSSMLDVPFSKNTSFSSDAERVGVISHREWLTAYAILYICRALPRVFLQLIWQFRAARRSYISPGTFGSIKDNYDVT
jgi:hypothetical protein